MLLIDFLRSERRVTPMYELEAIYRRLGTLVALCLATLAFGLTVVPVPGYAVLSAVLVMLIVGRWRLYATKSLFWHRSDQHGNDGEGSKVDENS
jgi:hypothetical protein